MNKETKHFLLGSVALLSLVVAGCSTEKKDSETTQVTTAEASTEAAIRNFQLGSNGRSTKEF